MFLGYTFVLTLISFLGSWILKPVHFIEHFSYFGKFILIPGNYLYEFIFIVFYLFTGFLIKPGLSENIVFMFMILFSSLITIFLIGGFLYWIYKKSDGKWWLRGGLYGYFIGGLLFHFISLLLILLGFSESFGPRCYLEIAFTCSYYFPSLIISIILGSIIGGLIKRKNNKKV